MNNVGVIGAGSWGTTLAMLLADKAIDVTVWCRREELAKEINNTKQNKQYLPNITLPNTLTATNSLEEVIKGKDMIVIAVPSAFLEETVEAMQPFLNSKVPLVHVIKGLTPRGQLASNILSTLKNPIAVLAGPNHAEEVAAKKPTATVIASKHEKTRRLVAKAFETPYFKTYPLSDVAGVEICGVMKNIAAIAVGVCDGLKLGDNAKSSILTLGLAEMNGVARVFGAKRATCYGLAGVGDLVATCFSKHSRNRNVGILLAQGKNMEQIKEEMHGMVAEGVRSTKTVYKIAQKYKTRLPLVSQAYAVLYEKKDLHKAIDELLDTI